MSLFLSSSSGFRADLRNGTKDLDGWALGSLLTMTRYRLDSIPAFPTFDQLFHFILYI